MARTVAKGASVRYHTRMIDFRGLPRTFWILWAGALVNRLGSFVMPLLAIYLSSARGFSVERVGLVMSLFGAGAVLAGPLGGFLADHVGRRLSLILSLSLGAAAMLHLGFARAPLHIAVAAFLLGLVGETYRPAVSAAIADLVPPADRVRAYGLLYWAVNIGFAVGSSAGGAMAAHGWWLLFLGDAVTTFAFAGIVLWRVPETRPARAAHEPRPPIWAPLADGPFVVFCVIWMMIWMIFFQTFSTLPIDMQNRGLSPAAYGSLIALNGTLIGLFQPLVSRLLVRFPRHRVLAAAAAIVGVGFGLIGVARSIPALAFAFTVWTAGEIAMAGIGPAVAADAAPGHLRGAYQGLLGMSVGASALLGPIAGSLVMGRFGAPALWTSCLAVGVAAAVGHLALGTLKPHAPAEAPANPAASSGIDPA
jgi:MFS family permease